MDYILALPLDGVQTDFALNSLGNPVSILLVRFTKGILVAAKFHMHHPLNCEGHQQLGQVRQVGESNTK